MILFLTAIYRISQVSRYQNVLILDFMEDNEMVCDNWSCKTCIVLVKSSPPTNKHPAYYRAEGLKYLLFEQIRTYEGTKIKLQGHGLGSGLKL